MNLINDPWIPAMRADGSQCLIAPWQIAETDNPVVELAAPRPDFQGALYQFLIGLLQTAFTPEDSDEWLEFWKRKPKPQQYKITLSRFAEAFELNNPDGAAFLQDFSLSNGEIKPVEALLIESPGGKTRKDNLDHFVKGGRVAQMCLSCAAMALFTLQSNAPAGGQGHRVGLRGGGPLTTLVIADRAETLWNKLWTNVLTEDEFEERLKSPNSLVFPWLAVTRYSDKAGKTTFPEDVHPLQQYWGMPRRIRLNVVDDEISHCSLCDVQTHNVIRTFHTKNNGTNYDGPWVHPLTPYRFDPNKKNIPLSLKGQQGGFGYRHWLGLAWQDDGSGDRAAAIVRAFNEERIDLIGAENARLWCFGYDMDNMKARCWYEHTLPLLRISEQRQSFFLDSVAQLLTVAKETVILLRKQVKAAWFNRPAEAKGDMSLVVSEFWQQTETDFYRQLNSLSQLPNEFRQIPSDIARQWLTTIQTTAMDLFDQWAMESSVEDMNMRRILKARQDLKKKLVNAKPFKDLRQIAQAAQEVAV